MNKPLSVRSAVRAVGKRTAVCPKCGCVSELHDYSRKTGLYYISIRLRTFHNRKFSVCPKCKSAFEVEE